MSESKSRLDENTFRRYLSLGWGCAGPILSGVRRAARQCGVDLGPMGFGRMTPMNTFEIRATGPAHAVDQFEAWMDEHYPDGMNGEWPHGGGDE